MKRFALVAALLLFGLPGFTSQAASPAPASPSAATTDPHLTLSQAVDEALAKHFDVLRAREAVMREC